MPFLKKNNLSKHLKLSECKANITIEFMARNFKCTIVKSFGFDFVRANGSISRGLSILSDYYFSGLLPNFYFKTSLLKLKGFFFTMVLIQAFRF